MAARAPGELGARATNAAYEHVVEGGHTYRDRARTLFKELGIEA